MAGQIIKRGDKKYLVRVYAGTDPQTGKRKYVNKTIRTGRKDAEKALTAMLRDLDAGVLGAPSRASVGELFDDLIRDYRINGKDAEWCSTLVETHLRPAFGGTKVARLTSDAVEDYIETKREAGLSNGYINRHSALLRRSLTLGKRATPPKVVNPPVVPSLKEAAPRKGFFEPAEYRAMLRELPDHVRPVLTFAYYTGCRRGEILGLKWDQVDLAERVVRLHAGETKSGEGRIIPLTINPLYESLKMQRQTRDELFPDSPWVFSRFGEPIKDFRESWTQAAKRAADKKLGKDAVPSLWDAEAKKPTKLFHDLRRTGVRNLVRAGVPERVAMAISGHKTRSVFDRYNIVNERDIKDAGRMLATYLEPDSGSDPHTMRTQRTQGAETKPVSPGRATASTSFFSVAYEGGANGETRTLTGFPTGT